MQQNPIIALVGKSGVGKTTLMMELLKQIPKRVAPIVVLTNRPKRGPEDEIFCRFVDANYIQDQRARGLLAQYLEYGGSVYGCAKADIDKALSHGIGLQAYVESGIDELRKNGYRVFPVQVTTDQETYRNEQRLKEDDERGTRQVEYALTLTNSFKPGGLEKAVQELTKFVTTLK